MDIQTLENRLNDFDIKMRKSALKAIYSIVQQGKIAISNKRKATNMHFHTFFSYNSVGWSPTRIAWEVYKTGLLTAGIVDFDVLDGMDEFLQAGEMLKLKLEAGLETRVFIKEWQDRVINSPKEPGIFYYMGTGFWKAPKEDGKADDTLKSLKRIARQRNINIIERVNKYLRDVKIDYEQDVIPLTPSGNATERHIVLVYATKADKCFPNMDKLCKFWSDILGKDKNIIELLMQERSKFYEVIRSSLMKYKGPGYIKPDVNLFPRLEEAISMTYECEAIPTATWLDGTSDGEKNPEEFLSFLIQKRIQAVNIIPDRNWNIKQEDEKNIKIKNLHRFLDAAIKMGLPVVVGTEMNRLGQPVEDNLDGAELLPYRDFFIRSSFILTGHTIMARYLAKPITGKWAESEFGKDIKRRNMFYESVGEKYSLGEKVEI